MEFGTTGILRPLLLSGKSLIALLFYFYLVFGFVPISIYMLGFIAMGEILQRLLSKRKTSFIVELFMDFVRAIPYIVVLSVLWLVFLFFANKRDRSATTSLNIASFKDALQGLSVYLAFVAFKYFTYIGIAAIAFGDRNFHSSFQEAKKTLKSEKIKLTRIWVQSGIGLGLLLLTSIGLAKINENISLINQDYLYIAIIPAFLTYLFFALYSEQVSLLLHYIETRHQKYDLRTLMAKRK